MTKIQLEELERIMELLLAYLRRTSGTELDIEKDLYWAIPVEQRYDVNEEPSEWTIGQLSEDWARLKEILDDDELMVGHAFTWLASLLRVIGEEVP